MTPPRPHDDEPENEIADTRELLSRMAGGVTWRGPTEKATQRWPLPLMRIIEGISDRHPHRYRQHHSRVMFEALARGLREMLELEGQPTADLALLFGSNLAQQIASARNEGEKRIEELREEVGRLCADGPRGVERARTALDDLVATFRTWPPEVYWGGSLADRAERQIGEVITDASGPRQPIDLMAAIRAARRPA